MKADERVKYEDDNGKEDFESQYFTIVEIEDNRAKIDC